MKANIFFGVLGLVEAILLKIVAGQLLELVPVLHFFVVVDTDALDAVIIQVIIVHILH